MRIDHDSFSTLKLMIFFLISRRMGRAGDIGRFAQARKHHLRCGLHVVPPSGQPNAGRDPARAESWPHPGAPAVAAERAPLRRPDRVQQAPDGGHLRRNAGAGVAPQLQRPATGDRAEQPVLRCYPEQSQVSTHCREGLPAHGNARDYDAAGRARVDRYDHSGGARRQEGAGGGPRNEPSGTGQAYSRYDAAVKLLEELLCLNQ